MDERWTIEQLTALVEKSLQTPGYNGQNNGRVRSVPDLRTIRYYTTLGLLDPPLEIRGRKAFYGRRHLLQLVAIKRLQSRGMSLAQVQQSMVSADDQAVARWAGLAPDFWDRVPSALPIAKSPTSPDALLAEPVQCAQDSPASLRNTRPFWAMVPELSEMTRASRSVSALPQLPLPAVHLPIANGVELVITGVEPVKLNHEALTRLRPSLEQLAQILHELRLTPIPPLAQGNPESDTTST